MARTKSVVLTMAEKNAILTNLKNELKTAKLGVKAATAAEAACNKAVAKRVKDYEAAAKRLAKDDQKVLAGLQKNTANAAKAVAAVEKQLSALTPPAPALAPSV